MKILFRTIIFLSAITTLTSCDNNDDAQTTPGAPTDGVTHNNTFYATENTYVSIDQQDANNDGYPDYYNFFFSNGRITDTYGDTGIGWAYAYSDNTTQLVKLKILAASNASLTTGTITAGTTYIASSTLTGGFNAGFSKDSFISYNLQTGSTNFGTENGFDFYHIPEGTGAWNYPGTVGPSITINTINIDSNIPANSTINVTYTFMNTNGDIITGEYEGTLGVILD